MQQQPWFKNWFNSPYYHQLYFERDEKEAAAFIDKLIDYLKPPLGSAMLDVACGKGRHSIQLAHKGFDVVGIDLSEDSIQEARQHEAQSLHFYQHDMRQIFWLNYFDYAFNFFTSFGYFDTRHEHDAAMQTIARSLKIGGVLVMDYLNVNYSENHFMPELEKKIGNNHFIIKKWHDKNHFYKKITIEDKLADISFMYTERVAKFFLKDFEDMFNRQGLQLQKVFGDYNLIDYDIYESPRLIMIANKIN